MSKVQIVDEPMAGATGLPNQVLRCLFGENYEPVKVEFKYQENVALKEAVLKHPQADTFQPDYPERPNSFPNDMDDVLISQWLTFAQTYTSHEVQSFDQSMDGKIFLVGKKLTLADAAVYIAMIPVAKETGLKGLPHARRWFDYVQHLFHPRSGQELVVFDSPPTLIRIGLGRGASSSSSSADASAKEKKGGEATAASGAPAASAAAKGKGDKGGDKAAPPVPPKDDAKKDKEGKEGKKKDKEGKKDAAAAPATTPAAEEDKDGGDSLDPSKLDIRVGLVTKCWYHPESEKLLCEEIDLGEGAVRSIASGLRPHYTKEQFEGRKVLVLANLKERSIAGFKSNGMVLAASNADHTVVKLLEPPASAAVGERVEFTGFSSEPATPAQMAKKKVLEKLAPALKTDAEGKAKWGDAAFFTLKSGGNVTADTLLPNATIS